MRFTAEPAFRRRDDDLIPRPMLYACFALVLGALTFTTWSVVSGRDTVGQPQPAAVLAERALVLEGAGAQAVRVKNPDGSLLLHLDNGGFIAVVQGGLDRARLVRGVEAAAPVRLVSYANGRLALEDPSTGWSVELGAFGDKNKAVWTALLTD